MADDELPERRYRRCDEVNDGAVAIEESKTIWEAGHYYQDLGPTRWSVTGWEILARFRSQSDRLMLFVDDVHSRDEVHPLERSEEIVVFSPQPHPDLLMNESAMTDDAFVVLECLKRLPKRKKARLTWRPRRWSCSGMPLTTPDGLPMCLLFDLGLTWHKYNLGFREVINVLPFFYESEQRGLIRVARKIMPDLTIRVMLYDLDGHWYFLAA